MSCAGRPADQQLRSWRTGLPIEASRRSRPRSGARPSTAEREAIVGRLEMGYTYQELADATGKSGADAARKTAERALIRLAEAMRRARG
jgi:hypothetical protein